MVFGHLGGRRPGLAVDLHGEHLGWAERIGDQLRRFIRPRDDVDSLRPELADDAADPYPSRADAGAHWVDAVLVCRHGDLGSDAWFACQRPDDDRSRREFRDLELEQAPDQRLVRARYEHLRPAAALAFLEQEDLQVLADADLLIGDLFLRRQHALGLAQLEVDGVTVGALGNALDDPAQHLPLVLEDVLEHLVLLGIAQTLEDHFLADLGGQPRKVFGWQWDVDQVANRGGAEFRGLFETDLRGGVRHGFDHPAPAEDGDLGSIRVNVDPDALGRIEGAPVGGGQGRFHQAQQRLLGNALLFLDLIECLDEI